MIGNVPGGQHLAAGGAHRTVQVWHAGVCFPGGLFVLLVGRLAGSLLFLNPELSVSGQQFLLLGVIRQKHQQLIENETEVVTEKLPAVFVIFRGRYQPLSKFARVRFKFIELGLIAMQVILDGVNQVNVPLLEMFRYQVSSGAE